MHYILGHLAPATLQPMPTGSRFRKLREAYTTTSSGRSDSAAIMPGVTKAGRREPGDAEKGNDDADAMEPPSPRDWPSCRCRCRCCCFWRMVELAALLPRLVLGLSVSRAPPPGCSGALASIPSRNKKTGFGGAVDVMFSVPSVGCGDGLHATQGMTAMVTPSSVSPALFFLWRGEESHESTTKSG